MVEPGNIVPMDFKSNRWAGNIFDQLEHVFRTDMDELVNKDTLKFFENKVQSVGMSVKRLYSGVVQDIFPLSGDTAEPEQQLAAGEQVDVQDGVLISRTGATSTWADEMQLANNHVSDYDKVRISQLADVPEAQNKREQGNGMVPDSEDSITAEKNVTDGGVFSSEFDEDVFPLLAFSAHEEERRDLNQQKGDEEKYMALSKSCSSDVNGSLYSPPVPVLTQDCSLADSPLPLACDVDDEVQEKYMAVSNICSTEDDSVDLSTSVQSSERVLSFFCDEKEETVAVMSSAYCTSPCSCMTTKSSCAEFSKEADDVLHSRSSRVSECCTHDISAASSTKSLMMESNDDNALHANRSEFLDGSFKICHEEHFKKRHSEILMSPSESEFMYGLGARIGDLDLDNVDLSSNVKHDDGRSVVLYSNFPQPSSYRRKNFSYYKKLIHGAFNSRKRIAKEYEQLAIMYGDIDVESKQHFTQSSVSSFLNTALHAEGTQSSQEMSENDWQLL
ncbi:uncharacterized protein LOC125207805 [Salvia hispanica]|uniref:uncharacterized protein LOC125207805 n=1 Tax=Salvia hispanica TaxID=49212 RepID=UPI0020099099|nr:uncharacterized protein LOC125207805 [Salvia hispanica]